ncbi:hypothetical protein NEFER03_0820 [Nematocida sp. LUAm3]|nr:hypothetical protein NEFER03_0820 [Nematocida sp. LUAm3]KAI5174838.1 hypothetical protein NEFER02_0938 [Nematocida sp. LUAm2]KAI5177564.1 hypothetical protein NEFER01_0814 [Nematocida sp. LUAm1]
MGDLDSELDVVVSDDREIEELGRSMIQGICMRISRNTKDSSSEKISRMGFKSSVTFSEVFNEVFKEERMQNIRREHLEEEKEKKESDSEEETGVIAHPIRQKKKYCETKKITQKGKSKHEVKAEGRRKEEKEERKDMAPRRWARETRMERVHTFSCKEKEKEKVFEAETYSCSLRSTGVGPSDGILRLPSSAVAELLQKGKRFFLFDCRFEYEYSGGHISGAINAITQKDIQNIFKELIEKRENSSSIFVFYCEYSSVRAPKLATYFRNEDRKRSSYPYLIFPNLYVMSGGYKNFYGEHPEFCKPCNYTPM